MIGGRWRLAVGGWSPLAAGGWWSLGAVLSKKKKSGPLRTALFQSRCSCSSYWKDTTGALLTVVVAVWGAGGGGQAAPPRPFEAQVWSVVLLVTSDWVLQAAVGETQSGSPQGSEHKGLRPPSDVRCDAVAGPPKNYLGGVGDPWSPFSNPPSQPPWRGLQGLALVFQCLSCIFQTSTTPAPPPKPKVNGPHATRARHQRPSFSLKSLTESQRSGISGDRNGGRGGCACEHARPPLCDIPSGRCFFTGP